MTEITDIHCISGTHLRNSLLLSPLIQQGRYFSFSPEAEGNEGVHWRWENTRPVTQALCPNGYFPAQSLCMNLLQDFIIRLIIIKNQQYDRLLLCRSMTPPSLTNAQGKSQPTVT